MTVPVYKNDAEGFGQAVYNFQKAISDLGYEIHVDGSFGPETQQAFKMFQSEDMLSKHGLTPEMQGSPQAQPMETLGLAYYELVQYTNEDSRAYSAFSEHIQDYGQIAFNSEISEPEKVLEAQIDTDDQVTLEGENLKFSGTICDDIKSLQGFLGIPEHQQVAQIGPKTIEGVHGKLEDVFGDNWPQALQAMKSDSVHSGEEWNRFTEQEPEIAILIQQLDTIEDPRYQDGGATSLFDSLIPNGTLVEPAAVNNEPSVEFNCDPNAQSSCTMSP